MWERVVIQGGVEWVVSEPPFDGSEAEARAWLAWKAARHAEGMWVGEVVGDQIALTKNYNGRSKDRIILIRPVP